MNNWAIWFRTVNGSYMLGPAWAGMSRTEARERAADMGEGYFAAPERAHDGRGVPR